MTRVERRAIVLLERHGDFVGLADVADVERAFDERAVAAEAFRRQICLGPRDQRRETLAQLFVRHVGRPAQHRQRIVLRHVGQQHAERREHAGVARRDHRGDVERVGDLAGVHAAGAAEGEQRELARIESALHGHDANGALHVGVGDAHDAFRQRRLRHAEPRRELLGVRARARLVERHAPAEEIARRRAVRAAGWRR